MTDLDIAEDLGARADQHAVADLRMPVAALLAGAAERHVLQHRHVVLDRPPSSRPRGRSHDRGRCRARCAPPDEYRSGTLPKTGSGDKARNPARLLFHSQWASRWVWMAWKPLKYRTGSRRRVQAGSRSSVATISARNASPIDGSCFERVGVGLADELGRHLRTIETRGDAMNDRCLQRVVMQNARIDERRQLALVPYDLLGFATDPRPYRVHLIQPSGSHLLPGHDRLLTFHYPRKPSTFDHAMDTYPKMRLFTGRCVASLQNANKEPALRRARKYRRCSSLP